MNRKNYYAIDIMKFIAAIFVIYLHTQPFQNINDNLDFTFLSVSKIAVPFFFVTSGYQMVGGKRKDEGIEPRNTYREGRYCCLSRRQN